MKWLVALSAAAAVVCLVSAQECPCSENFVLLNDDPANCFCVHFTDIKGTWYAMRDYCVTLGTSLAKLTGEKHQQVVAYINSQQVGDLDDEAFWIGGTDEGHEGSWKWLDGDTIPLGTPHWYPCNNQPNGGTTQNHLCLYTPDFYFHSLESSRLIKGICQV